MAKARAIVKRRKAVRNIHKITQTMQLIATARFQKCLQRAVASRPYTEKITELIQTLSGSESVQHVLLKPNLDVKPSIMLILTSNRGLCGAYNAAVLRQALEHQRQTSEAGLEPALELVGKKGIGYMRFLGHKPSATITDVEDQIEYARVAAMAERYMQLYAERAIARVDVVHMRFHSVGSQRPAVVQLLPIEPPQAEDAPRVRPEFEFSPPSDVLMSRLIPETVKVRLFQCFNDAIVSEQVSRMVAMKAATDAASDMIKFLTRRYNRARQTQITLELLDIVGGAEALK
ncbi:MAG: ATP synthase F1 subunit gamma [Planctomycetes bacterium]|nr:ATP synthase F1 subunit gamma [Planctomycetota bacterium]